MQRWKDNDWDEKDDRDDKEFLDVEKEIWMEMFPDSVHLLHEDEIEEEEDNDVVELNSTSDSSDSKGVDNNSE